MSRLRLKMDERNVQIVHQLQSISHSVTLLLLIAFFLRRLHILGQSFEDNWDIGMLIMLNGAFLLGGVLYRGGITWPRLRPRWVVALYLAFSLVVIAFKCLVEFMIKGRPFQISELFSHEFLMVLAVCACVMAVFTAIAYLGQRELERELE